MALFTKHTNTKLPNFILCAPVFGHTIWNTNQHLCLLLHSWLQTHFTHNVFDPRFPTDAGPRRRRAVANSLLLNPKHCQRPEARRSTWFYYGSTQWNPCYQCLSAAPALFPLLLSCAQPSGRHTPGPPCPFSMREQRCCLTSDMGSEPRAASRVKRSRLDHPGQIKRPFHVWSACSPKDKSHWVPSLNSGPMFPLRCRCNFLARLLWLLPRRREKWSAIGGLLSRFTTNTSVVPFEAALCYQGTLLWLVS